MGWGIGQAFATYRGWFTSCTARVESKDCGWWLVKSLSCTYLEYWYFTSQSISHGNSDHQEICERKIYVPFQMRSRTHDTKLSSLVKQIQNQVSFRERAVKGVGICFVVEQHCSHCRGWSDFRLQRLESLEGSSRTTISKSNDSASSKLTNYIADIILLHSSIIGKFLVGNSELPEGEQSEGDQRYDEASASLDGSYIPPRQSLDPTLILIDSKLCWSWRGNEWDASCGFQDEGGLWL